MTAKQTPTLNPAADRIREALAARGHTLSVDGKPVTFEMMSEDDQADPKVGTTVAQKLVGAFALEHLPRQR